MKKTKKNSKEARVASRAHFDAVPAEEFERSLWLDPFIHMLLIVSVGFAVYARSMSVPFIFDDYTYIVENPAIKSFDCFPDTQNVFNYAIFQDIKNNLILRPLAYFTFALNYALHGVNPFGYHLVNLLLHIGNAMLVYCLFAQLLVTPAIASESTDNPGVVDYCRYLPLFASLLFVCHPLQTQAVTYIIQRFVPLATFFYLAAIVLYLRSRMVTTPNMRRLVYALALLATILAMESKEIAFTVPLVIAFVEWMFFSGERRNKGIRLLPFFLVMAIIPVKIMQLPSSVTAAKTESLSDAINLVNVGSVSSWDYLMTEFGVITTYLRLLLLPINQNLDHDYSLQRYFFSPQVLLPLVALLTIIGAGVYLLKRASKNRLNLLVSFGIFWFFVTLSVESSLIPIEDVIFEHRAYLPSVGFFIALLAGTAVALKHLPGNSVAQSHGVKGVLVALVGMLSVATSARNAIWQDEVTLWQDAVRKSPNKARAHEGLGGALFRKATFAPEMLEGITLMKDESNTCLAASVKASREAIRLNEGSPAAHFNLAKALGMQKKFDEALDVLATASNRWPTKAMPYVLRGELFEAKKDLIRARMEYLAAEGAEPFSHLPHVKLADLYTKEGDIQSAITELEMVMRIFPDESTRKKLQRLKPA